MSKTALLHPAKAVYFATGTPELALRDITRLGLASNGTALRVVSPRAGCAEIARHPSLQNTPVIAYSPGRALWVWLRLLGFLGLTRNVEIFCLDTPQNYRLLKLLAFSLRGRGRFSTGDGACAEVSFRDMLRLSWRSYFIRREQRNRSLPVLFIGSGSADSLRLIASRVRRRRPGQRITAWLPAALAGELTDLFDEVVARREGFGDCLRTVARLIGNRRQFGATIIPCTNEFNGWMKLPALLLPLREKEIYNEVGDVFAAGDLRSGIRHFTWRFFRTNRKLAWPVAVIGSSSGYYLEKIVASIRKSFPGSQVHGWLGPLQATSAGHLFDVVHPLPSSGFSASAAWRLLKLGSRYRGWIVPCTDEGFRALKLLAFVLPLPRRRLYNEAGDGFPLRAVATVWKHIFWRLRYKFTFQFLSGSSDSTFLRRLIHIPAYAARLAAAAPHLYAATRTRRNNSPNSASSISVDVLATDCAESRAALALALDASRKDASRRKISLNVHELHANQNVFAQLRDRAESSSAEYLCILDGQCHLTTNAWLDRLLDAFDETVAQVGPEIHLSDRREICQGAFFDGTGGLTWNTNSAARFHRRQALLEVAALPWVCLVIRREALLQIAPECTQQHAGPDWILAELCERFARNGWLSICNTEVAVSHPLKAPAEQMQLSTAT